MKSRIQFFKDSQFKTEDSEAAAIFSILMDKEFQQQSQAKNEFLKSRMPIAVVVALVGVAFLFIPIYPAAIALLVGAAAAAFYFYRQQQEKGLSKYIERMGKFHWKISLFPFRDGSVAIDESCFHDTKELSYPFIDGEHNDSLSAQRQEFAQMAGNQDLFLDELDNGDNSKPFAYYGVEKRIKEILENSNSILAQPNEKSVSGPLLPATSIIDTNIMAILKNLESYPEEMSGAIVSIQEQEAGKTYDSLVQMDSFLNQDRDGGLEETLDGWIEELKEFLGKRDNGSSQKGLSDFREEFLSHCDAPGYNHYCPECNKNYNAASSEAVTFTFDENSRMFLKLPGKWQCPVCGHNTPDPIKIQRVYDEIIYPVARLLMLDEKAGSKQESLLNQIVSTEFDRRLKTEKEASLKTFTAIFDEADRALIQTKAAKFEELVNKLESSISVILKMRSQLEESMDTFKVDLSIPSPIQIHVPFYMVKFGGEEADQGLQVITPSSLVKSRDSESAVNYKFEQDNTFKSYSETIQQKMTALLNDKKYRLEAVKDQKQISRGMQRIKDTDFYSEQRDQFFDFIDKTYFQGQEN
jgi:Arc/MetJ-type ribon-helix-helix transcriptional regulator